jgi:hypothetical protein
MLLNINNSTVITLETQTILCHEPIFATGNLIIGIVSSSDKNYITMRATLSTTGTEFNDSSNRSNLNMAILSSNGIRCRNWFLLLNSSK